MTADRSVSLLYPPDGPSPGLPAIGVKNVDALTVVYTNHRGVTAIRRIWPIAIWYGSNQWHPEMQWLLKAVDMDNGEERDFAFAKMKGAP